MKVKKQYITITNIIIGINCAIFLALSLIGRTENGYFLLKFGALYYPYIEGNQEHYRLITSIFLHSGIEHLGNNMLLLFIIGNGVEKVLGKSKYVLIYILSGIGGNILSLMHELQRDEYAISVGASGAIFGILGAMLWVMVCNKGRIENISIKGIIVIIFINLYLGFADTSVNNFAHVGGLVVGAILCVVFYTRHQKHGRMVE